MKTDKSDILLMKAIHYKGQNKFYLFDKPEEPRKKDFQLEDDAYIDPIYYDALDYYEQQLESNLSAGKEIINPEVAKDVCWRNDTRINTSESIYIWEHHVLTPGDIFDLPPHIRFEYEDACSSDCCTTDGRCGEGCREPLKVIRLFLKDEDGAIKLLTALQVKEESQYELWDDAINTYNCLDVEFEREAINYLKSKFTITRNQ